MSEIASEIASENGSSKGVSKKLSIKYERQMLFGYWLLKELKNEGKIDEARTLRESFESQKNITKVLSEQKKIENL